MVEENVTPSFSKELSLTQPASLLEMAQRVHDDFVEKGRATADKLEFDAQKKHDELISSAKEFHDITILETESNAAAIIEDAQLSAFSLISDAKIKADGIVSGAQESILRLETSILKLQEFEAAYRENLQALVAGAQATLVVAELAVEDRVLPPVDDENKDLSADENDAVETEDYDDEKCLGGNDGLIESDEVYESSPERYIYNLDTPEQYDPLAVKPDLDPELSASIIAASGLTEDTEADDESIESEDSDEDTSSEEVETADDATENEGEIEADEDADFVAVSSETFEPIYYDPNTLTSGTDPEIVAATVGEPGAGKSFTEDESSDDETDAEASTEDEKK